MNKVTYLAAILTGLAVQTSNAQVTSNNIGSAAQSFNPVQVRPAQNINLSSPLKTAGDPYNNQFNNTLVSNTQNLQYPWRTVGRLEYTTPQGTRATCTAAVIGRQLIATAAHCVHSGKSDPNGFNRDFIFMPAYNNGYAPYGKWTISGYNFTSIWYSGQGLTSANPSDFALLTILPQTQNGVSRKIGDVVGWLGIEQTQQIGLQVTKLSYPGNLLSGEKKIQTTSATIKTSHQNVFESAGNLGAGASGSPWIKSFCGTASCMTNPNSNKIVGFTSYKSSLTLNGASMLDYSWSFIYKGTCQNPGIC